MREIIVRMTEEYYKENLAKGYALPELIRCKDCKHRYNGETLHNCCEVLMAMSNWLLEIPVKDDWHCGSGERKE